MLTDMGNAPRVGDHVTFKAATRSHHREATRLITGFDSWGRVCVRYHGYGDFVILERELISVEEQAS